MQGRKELSPKMLYQVHIQDLVPEQNFYRLLDKAVDFHFLYKATAKYYGHEGQESIDPVVFFKICLVGYLNNINSDRRLIEYCSNCLDVRLFIRYDIDEALPWHSTISRTRQLYGEEVFLELFKKILSLCVQKGMVRGKRQAVDSAFIKANASMDSLLEKEVLDDATRTAKIRSKTVEPVLGTLINFTNMKRVNTRGIKQANKHVIMAALTYNLKKYLKFIVKKPTIQVQRMTQNTGKPFSFLKRAFYELITAFLSCPIFVSRNFSPKINLA